MELADKRILVLYTGGNLGKNTLEREELDWWSLGGIPQATVDQIRDTFLVHGRRWVPYTISWKQLDIPGVWPTSENANFATFNALAAAIAEVYADYDGFVIIYHVDTLCYAASTLAYQLENLTKPVLFVDTKKSLFASRSDASSLLARALDFVAHSGVGLVPPICEVGVMSQQSFLRAVRTFHFSNCEFRMFEAVNLPPLLVEAMDEGIVAHIRELLLLPPPLDSCLVAHPIRPLDIYPIQLPGYFRLAPHFTQADAVILQGAEVSSGDRLVEELRAYAAEKFVFYFRTQPPPDPNWIDVNFGITDFAQLLGKVLYILSRTTDRDLVRQLFRANLRGESYGPIQRETDILGRSSTTTSIA